MLTIVVFEIKEGKNAQKLKKYINRTLLIAPTACMLKKP
jgi:hypothetical protein